MKNPPRRLLALVLAAGILSSWVVLTPGPVHAHPSGWRWPLGTVALEREYLAPVHPFGPGHRGIDLHAEAGDSLFSPAAGTVRFAGLVAQVPVVSIDHGGGWVSSFEPATSIVPVGASVRTGQRIGAVGQPIAHCSCLHFGVRFNGEYVSPLLLVGEVPAAVLLPW